MAALDSELEGLYGKIHSRDPSIEECPPEPSPLRSSRGRVPADTPVHADERARCTRCDYRGICDGLGPRHRLPWRQGGRFGHAWPVTPIGEIETRASVIGEVVGLRGPRFSKTAQ